MVRVNLKLSTAPSVNGDLTINNNLIKTTIKPKKIDVVDGLDAPEDNKETQANDNECLTENSALKTDVKTAEQEKEVVEITGEAEPETVENSIDEDIKEPLEAVEIVDNKEEEINEQKPIETSEEVKVKSFNKQELILGFNEAKNQIKNLYDTIFGYGDKFKPTYQDTVGDLLSYLGGIAYRLGNEKNYTEVFGVSVSSLNDKYYTVSYVPYAIKIAVWAYKNKGKRIFTEF